MSILPGEAGLASFPFTLPLHHPIMPFSDTRDDTEGKEGKYIP